MVTLCEGDATLAFGGGLSNPDEPDVLLADFTGRKRLWLEVGQPEEKPLLRACSQADAVVVYAYAASAEIWWRGIETRLTRLGKLQVWRLPATATQELATMAERSMHIQATIQDGALSLSNARTSAHIEPELWK